MVSETKGMNRRVIELILSGLRMGGSAEVTNQLSQLNNEDCQLFIKLARQLRVTPLLHHRLSRTNSHKHNPAAETLRQDFLRNTARNIRLYQELKGILRKLKESNIKVILLKGAFLAEKVYANIGLRPMTDMDLLIHQEDLEPAIALMKGLGYTPERPYWSEVDGELHFHAPMMVKNGKFLELHWNLTRETNLSQINIDSLWGRAQPSSEGDNLWVLSPSDLVIHLAVHAAYGHQFYNQFLSLVDLAEVINHYGDDLDWDEIARICEAWQAKRGTYLTLRLAREVLKVEVPESALKALLPGDWNESVLVWAKERLFKSSPVLSDNYIRLMQNKNPAEKIQALIAGLLPPKKIMAMEYGIPASSVRIYFLYPKHVTSKLKKYWQPFVQWLRGDSLQEAESEGDQDFREWLGIG